MEKKLMLPANYNVMNEEEMTYTSGGDGFTAPFAVGWTIGAVISVANLIWGLDQTRTWIKNNKKNRDRLGHGRIVLTRQPGELQRTTQGGGSPQAGGPPPFLFTDCFWKYSVGWGILEP